MKVPLSISPIAVLEMFEVTHPTYRLIALREWVIGSDRLSHVGREGLC